MHAEGETYRQRLNMTSFPVFTYGIYSDLPPEPLPEPSETLANTKGNSTEDKPVSLQSILNNKNTIKVC